MKNKIFFASAVALASLATVSCEDYNNQFNLDSSITDVRNATITLTSSDYSTIASNSTNQALAASLDAAAGGGTTYVDALAAVGSNGYFSTLASAEDYVPAFLASSDNYRLADVGSRFTVNVNYYKDPSGYLSDFEGNDISTYDFTSDDYESVWGDAAQASFLTPATLSQIPGILSNAISGATDGDMVVVNYAYSELEPSTGGSTNEETSYTPISDVLSNTGGGNYIVSGTVVGTYARGFLLQDETGIILVYVGTTANYSIGDIVSVSGATTQYSGLMQFQQSSEITLLGREETFSYPTPTTMDGAALDSYVSSPSVQYVTYTGTLEISGSYYNVTVDGAETAIGSISYPVSGIVDSDLSGQEVTVTGYLIGSSGSSTYANTMATSVVAADGSGEEYTPVGIVAYADGGSYSVRGVVAATYARGLLVTDGSGYILVYNSNTGCVANDIVTVSGSISQYGGFNQYSSDAVVTKVGDGSYVYPTPREVDAVAMEAYLTDPYIGYVTYEGTLTISGSYYNISIDGSTNVVGSLSYPENIDTSLDGSRVIVTGYAIGTSSSRYFNTMVTSVVAATESTSTKSIVTYAVGSVSTSQPNASALYVYSGTSWSEYSTDAASTVVLAPAVYTQYGSSEISSSAIDDVAAVYLLQKLPYAQDGDLAAVVYNSGSINVKEYTLSSGAWIPTPEYEELQYIFEHKEDGWSADMSTYLSETFLGSTGGFEIQDVNLGGLTYVWKVQSSYGWTASAYASSSNHAAESWIVSPLINFTRATAPQMQMDVAVNYLSSGTLSDHCNIMITTNYTGDVTTSEWTVLTTTGWPTSDSWTFYTLDAIDLSDFVGERVNVAFRYTSSTDYAPTWEIKNLIIAEKDSMSSGEDDSETTE